jgi:hypothetical protein
MGNLNVIAKDNHIELEVDEPATIKSSNRCYSTWNGKYKIVDATREVTQEDINLLKDAGIFGCGQVVNATLVGSFINYNGQCDSSG